MQKEKKSVSEQVHISAGINIHALPKSILESYDDEDNLKNLLDGAAQLVNWVNFYKVTTLFFLDKSARPAATLFIAMYRKAFPTDKLPNIRFINIGRDIGSGVVDAPELIELKARYKSVLEGTILIADEFTSSGSTMIHAYETFSQIAPSANLLFTQIFEEPPHWYGDEQQLGVLEGRSSVDIRRILGFYILNNFISLPTNHLVNTVATVQREITDSALRDQEKADILKELQDLRNSHIFRSRSLRRKLKMLVQTSTLTIHQTDKKIPLKLRSTRQITEFEKQHQMRFNE